MLLCIFMYWFFLCQYRQEFKIDKGLAPQHQPICTEMPELPCTSKGNFVPKPGMRQCSLLCCSYNKFNDTLDDKCLLYAPNGKELDGQGAFKTSGMSVGVGPRIQHVVQHRSGPLEVNKCAYERVCMYMCMCIPSPLSPGSPLGKTSQSDAGTAACGTQIVNSQTLAFIQHGYLLPSNLSSALTPVAAIKRLQLCDTAPSIMGCSTLPPPAINYTAICLLIPVCNFQPLNRGSLATTCPGQFLPLQCSLELCMAKKTCLKQKS